MSQRPPRKFDEFVARFPGLGEGWELLAQAGRDAGPLDERTMRLVKLAVSVGALREGAVHSAVRKARTVGVSQVEIEQVVALAASTIGLPSAVAAWTWVRDTDEQPRAPGDEPGPGRGKR